MFIQQHTECKKNREIRVLGAAAFSDVLTDTVHSSCCCIMMRSYVKWHNCHNNHSPVTAGHS